MKKPEGKLWDTIRQLMGNSWEAERIENRLNSGVPDVAYSMRGLHGWLELKVVTKISVDSSKIIKIPHFVDTQRNWIYKHGSRGGHVYILLKLVNEYFVFNWNAAYLLGHAHYEDLITLSVITPTIKLTREYIIKAITTP